MVMRLYWILLCAVVVLSSSVRGGEIELTVIEPSGVARSGWPVTSGVPLARGALVSDRHLALLDATGKEVPLQTEVLSRWPDGSIRWVLLDFQVDLASSESQQFVLRYGPEVRRAAVSDPVEVIMNLVSPMVGSGRLRIEVSPDRFRLLDAVWLDQNSDGQYSDDERVTREAAPGILLVGSDGTHYRADLAHANVSIEQHGPLRVCVRIDGVHRAEDNRALFRYVARMHLFRGQPFVKLEYTFINDYQDALMAKFNAIELVCQTVGQDVDAMVLNAGSSGSSRLVQVDDQQFEIDAKKMGQRGAGWAAVGSPSGGMAVGVRQFWQNWPKSLEVKPGELRIGLCPDFDAGRYDDRPFEEDSKHTYYLRDGVYTLKVGVAKTHELWANFFAGEPPVVGLSEFYQAVEKPLLAQCSPEYVCGTGVLEGAPPADPKKYHGYDAWLAEMFQKHLEDQLNVRENGMLNFGDWWHFNKFRGGWGNQEYDTSHIFFTQYLRTGDRRYFDRATQGACHLMDVDTMHVANGHVRKQELQWRSQPGRIWTHSLGHTGGYFEDASLDAALWTQVGMIHDFGHVWLGGLADCYCLTGNRRTLEVARLISDRVAGDCPTPYGNHIRDVGWPLNLMITAYELTGDDRYLAAAERQWQILKKNLDTERGWVVMLAYGHCTHEGTAGRCRGQNSYLLAVTLSALARYHQITGDPEVLQGITAGLDQMIRECWNEEHKSFYPTSCIHQRDQPPPAYSPTNLLCSLAFAHEIGLTGNREHKRIFRAGFKTAIDEGRKMFAEGTRQFQAGYTSRAFHFTPYGLRALED